MLSHTKNAAEPAVRGVAEPASTSHVPTTQHHRPADEEERERARRSCPRTVRALNCGRARISDRPAPR